MFTCPICDKVCDSDRGLKIHLGRIHKNNPENNTKQKPPEVFKIPSHTYSVPLGTVIKLTGQCFCQDNETKLFSLLEAEGLTAKVVHKEFQPQTNQSFLFCSVYRSESLWAILESEVLNNRFQIVSWGEVADVEGMPISPSVDIPLESPFDPQERKTYLEAVERYASVRDRKLSVNTEFTKVDAETRPPIVEYLKKYGVETIAGKGDNCLIDGGYEVIYSNVVREPIVERDMGRIVQWLIDNAHFECLKSVLNVDAWEELKKLGVVPPEFLVEVEIPKKAEPDRKLYVKKVESR